MIIRTAEEIKNKIKEGFFENNPLDFGVYDIIYALCFEEAEPYLTKDFLNNPDAKDLWEKERLKTKDDVLNKMKDYLNFAYDKANNKRGISANISIQHYIAWAWLINNQFYNELMNMYETEYRDYGKNILSYIEKWLNNQ